MTSVRTCVPCRASAKNRLSVAVMSTSRRFCWIHRAAAILVVPHRCHRCAQSGQFIRLSMGWPDRRAEALSAAGARPVSVTRWTRQPDVQCHRTAPRCHSTGWRTGPPTQRFAAATNSPSLSRRLWLSNSRERELRGQGRAIGQPADPNHLIRQTPPAWSTAGPSGSNCTSVERTSGPSISSAGEA